MRFSLVRELEAGLARGTGESEEAGRRSKDPEEECFLDGEADDTGVLKELAWRSASKTRESGFSLSPRTRGRFAFLAEAEAFEVSAITGRSRTEEAARSRDRFPILRFISGRVVSSLSISDKGDVGT